MRKMKIPEQLKLCFEDSFDHYVSANILGLNGNNILEYKILSGNNNVVDLQPYISDRKVRTERIIYKRILESINII